MKNLRAILAAVLCISLLALAGCGNDKATDNNSTEGTMNNESTDSITEDMRDEATDMKDDIKDAVDGTDIETGPVE